MDFIGFQSKATGGTIFVNFALVRFFESAGGHPDEGVRLWFDHVHAVVLDEQLHDIARATGAKNRRADGVQNE